MSKKKSYFILTHIIIYYAKELYSKICCNNKIGKRYLESRQIKIWIFKQYKLILYYYIKYYISY